MRKLLCLLLVVAALWGIEEVAAIQASPVSGAAQFMPPGVVAASLREGVSIALPHTSADRLAPRPSDPVIALTFDDGPTPTFTPQILAVLERYGVSATFFCIGQQVQHYPALVQQTSRAGDAIENHTWSHPVLTRLSPDAIRMQLNETSLAIRGAIGVSPQFFRPPYGATNGEVRSIASQLGLTQVLWTIDTRDWQRPGVNAIVRTVLSNARNGSIVQMHDGGGNRSQTVQALPQIILGLRQRGFSFVIV